MLLFSKRNDTHGLGSRLDRGDTHKQESAYRTTNEYLRNYGKTYSQDHVCVDRPDLTYSQDHVCVHLLDLTYSQDHVMNTHMVLGVG
jgi:hypothetical protein